MTIMLNTMVLPLIELPFLDKNLILIFSIAISLVLITIYFASSSRIIDKIKSFIISNVNIKYSFMLPLFVKSLLEGDTNIEDKGPFFKYILSMTILQTIVLTGFFSIFCYVSVLYLIQHYNIETKFPKFIKIINYFKFTTKGFIIFEVLLVFFIQILLIIANIYLIIILY
jgi:hypothetical protein